MAELNRLSVPSDGRETGLDDDYEVSRFMYEAFLRVLRLRAIREQVSDSGEGYEPARIDIHFTVKAPWNADEELVPMMTRVGDAAQPYYRALPLVQGLRLMPGCRDTFSDCSLV